MINKSELSIIIPFYYQLEIVNETIHKLYIQSKRIKRHQQVAFDLLNCILASKGSSSYAGFEFNFFLSSSCRLDSLFSILLILFII